MKATARTRTDILATLPSDVAADAAAALDSLAPDDDDLAWKLVSQLELQTFLWYSLPIKWLMDRREHHEIAWALGDFFRAAGKPRCADICRAQDTHLLIDLWDTDSPRARTLYDRLLDHSGVYPPETDSLSWGSLMGLTEALAFIVASDALEDALDDSTLTPGARGWRGRAVAVTEAALAQPYGEAPDFSLAGAVRRERREEWVEHFSRRGLAVPAGVAGAIAAPSVEDLTDDDVTAGHATAPSDVVTTDHATAPSDVAALEGVAASLEPLVWLLGEIGDGITLTQTGNLPRALAVAADERYDWLDLKPRFRVRSADDLYQLSALYDMVTDERWVTKRGRRLSLSAKGRKLLDDPVALTWAVLGYLFDLGEWYGDGAVAAAVALLDAGDAPLSRDALYDRLLPYLGTHWAAEGTLVQTRNDISGVLSRFDSLVSAFGWLGQLPPWEWSLHEPLNEAGRAACLAGLRQLASGPWLRM